VTELKSADTRTNEGAPKIDQFLLYAERSIKLGYDCRALEGDVGIRTSLEVSDRTGSAQLVVGRGTRCRNLFSPSTSLENIPRSMTSGPTPCSVFRTLESPRNMSFPKECRNYPWPLRRVLAARSRSTAMSRLR
jgi:hypothetical protein